MALPGRQSHDCCASLATIIIIITAPLAMAMTISESNTTQQPNTEWFALQPPSNDTEELRMQHARFILGNMNQSVDPCENFYDFACGNWPKTELLPAEARNDTFLHSLQRRVDVFVLAFLRNATETELQAFNTTRADLKAKQFHHSCMQMKANMSQAYQHLLGYQDDRYAARRSTNDSLDWVDVNFMSHFDVYPLLPMKVHYSTPTRKFVVLLSLPAKMLVNVNEATLKNLTRDLQLEEGSPAAQEFNENFQNLTQFERNLTELAKTRNETQQLSLGDFLTKHKQDRLNWTRYFDVAFNSTQQKNWLVLNLVDTASIAPLVYFLEHAPLQTLRGYLRMRVLLKFYNIWKLETLDKNITNACRVHTEAYFNYALLPWFIDSVFDKERRADILGVAKNIKDTFYEMLDRYSWLDDETKSQAKTKLASMDVLVGYSDELQHRELIDKLYNDTHMTGNWFEELVHLEGSRAGIRLRSVDKALIPQLMPTRSVNAYYADFLNLAFITIGMAQWPFYHMGFPEVFKYAGIGNIIGHEMAHGFDSYCYQFNYDGKKINWWSAASLRNFRERYRCLESQYNKLILLGVQTNGTLTSGDNIADNVGIRMAYYAYKRRTGDKAWQQKPVRGLDFNNKQLFFLKFAQTWCTGRDSSAKMKTLKTDVHAYDEFRVTGTLSNMPEFSEAFNCKLGTDMNPLKKCVIF